MRSARPRRPPLRAGPGLPGQVAADALPQVAVEAGLVGVESLARYRVPVVSTTAHTKYLCNSMQDYTIQKCAKYREHEILAQYFNSNNHSATHVRQPEKSNFCKNFFSTI